MVTARVSVSVHR